MKTLVMCCCVTPSTGITRGDPDTRRLDYEAALWLWLTRGPYKRIVVADGSGAIIITDAHRRLADETGIELIDFPCDSSEAARTGGKGRGEAKILSCVADRIAGEFTKVSGRIFCRNAAELETTTGDAVNLQHRGYADTRLFRTSSEWITKHLAPTTNDIFDWDRDHHIESFMARAGWSTLPVPARFWGVESSNAGYA